MLMGKKGQFFLITAVIIIMSLFTVVAKYNTIRQQIALEDFQELSEQYTEERPKVINAAIFSGEPEAPAVEVFTEQFIDYAQETQPTFGVLSVFKDSTGDVHITNSLNNKRVTIHYVNSQGVAQTNLLFCNSGDACLTQGEVCTQILENRFCTTVGTEAGNYGTEFANEQTISDITVLRLFITDSSGQLIDVGFYDISQLVDSTILTSEEVLEDGSLVRVSVNQN